MKKFSVMGLILLMGVVFLTMTACTIYSVKPNVKVKDRGSWNLDLNLVKKTEDFIYRVEMDKGDPKYYYTNVKPVEGIGHIFLSEVYIKCIYEKVYDIKTKEYLGYYCFYYPSIIISNGASYKIFQQK